jgi:hypothetical protein
MKQLILSCLAVLFVNGALAKSTTTLVDEKALTIQSLELKKVADRAPLLYPLEGLGSCDLKSPSYFEEPNPLTPISVVIDEIINIGKKIWTIVDAGKPVVNLKVNVGTALPKGVSCWLDLQNWSKPTTETYQATFTNGYGVEVVKLKYQLISVARGSYEGQGNYIAYATIVPTEVEVSWGFRLNAQVTVPTVYNMGSKENPMAGMNLQMTYTVDTVLKHGQYSHNFFLDGNGEIKRLN